MDQYKGSEEDKYRSFMGGEGEKNTSWKLGQPPNYELINKLFEEGRTKIWPAGSLEEQVQNLLKTWEMELVHKLNPKDYKSIDATKITFCVNGMKPLTPEEVGKMGGGYNMFLQTSLPKQLRLYNPENETGDSATKTFTTTFPRGFLIEVLHVYSGPPIIAFKFRHWGYMEGPYKGCPPTGEMVELFGVCIMELDGQFKMVKVEFFYDKGEFLAGLTKGAHATTDEDPITDGRSSGCPFS